MSTSALFCETIFLKKRLHSPSTRSSPPAADDRLDMVIERIAARGVRVYILMWNETKMAMEGELSLSLLTLSVTSDYMSSTMS